MSVDTNRRVSASRPVGRALGGQDRFEKEALEGPAEGGLALARRQRMAGGTLRAGEESPFAAKLRKLAGGASDDER
ncbi:hypothetical protein [Myxococcus xanthus]|uniref:Uncharacterized protein n=1 Tax=Myxococcus xanthus TaxID=34 RepID=A0AAE6G602_MYXXA|nr:hypothetical protein [Myxococcus xanthus]QDE71567.1 hypothetical protein BHS09_33810 [Myxococcus xanthus]QDE78848.1 hypothetical protein BHS08_33835 [Myxococcus xanthus]QDE86219.1 hypothetical protein BHS07_34400 [Myxococcus xanthus]